METVPSKFKRRLSTLKKPATDSLAPTNHKFSNWAGSTVISNTETEAELQCTETHDEVAPNHEEFDETTAE